MLVRSGALVPHISWTSGQRSLVSAATLGLAIRALSLDRAGFKQVKAMSVG
jgi:hypothetical protein